MRRTKIVATLGPASSTREQIARLIEAGVDVFRLNQSHGRRAWHEAVFKRVRGESKRLGKPVAIMVDLQGPKMRIGRVADGLAELATGSIVNLRWAPGGISDSGNLYVPLPEIVKDLKKGDAVLCDDGNVSLKVISKARGMVKCRVVAGGMISDNKGINLPGVKLSVPSVTEKDLADLAWAAEMGAEYVAISFVRRPKDVIDVKMALHGRPNAPRVVAKIEKPEALETLRKIAAVSDGLMVARGDLGVEMPLEEVPVAQGRIVAAAHENDIPVIVATQMLESMTLKPRPTRAEVSDVAAAIFGGTDAVMLSGETAVGRYPEETVRQMAAIAEVSEAHLVESGALKPVYSTSALYAVADSVCHGASSAAADLGAKAVFISTTSGRTALLFSKYRFPGVLVGASSDERTVRRMALHWGVVPVKVPRCRSHHQLLGAVAAAALERGLVAGGDTVVFVAGTPLGATGGTNTMMVHRIKKDAVGQDRDVVSGDAAAGTLELDRRLCISCGACAGACPAGIWEMNNSKMRLVRARMKNCSGDWRCRDLCPTDAITITAPSRKRASK